MDPVEPWIDADAVRRMAAELLAAPAETLIDDRPDSGFGPGFEGFTALAQPPPPEAEAKPFLRAASHGTVPARGPGSAESVRSELRSPVEPSSREVDRRRGRLVERMGKFREWLMEQAGARGVFVLDRDGNPVLEDPLLAKLHFLARSLAQASRPAGGKGGNVHVKVGTDAYLVVIPVETAFGWLVMGTVLEEPLDSGSVEAVAQVLAEAARPGGG